MGAMTLTELQTRLQAKGQYAGAIDGKYGSLTRAGILASVSDGPDTKITPTDVTNAAVKLGLQAAHIKAVMAVESSSAGFVGNKPTLLFEPHRFSKATGGRYNATAPDISYPVWGMKPYPPTQDARYDQLCRAVGLDVDAGFASASYGRFQILGENFALCGYSSPFEFADAQAFDELTQLESFGHFLGTTGLLLSLRACNWPAFAKGYNGTAYRQNKYDTRLEAAFTAAGGK